MNTNPHVTALIMVKDEENTILTTLNSLSPVLINRVIVYDTGSTDGTLQQCREWGGRPGQIPLHIAHGPWINFGESRNGSLEACEKFADSDWILHLDANDQTRLRPGSTWEDVNKYLRDPGRLTTAQLVQRDLLMRDDTIKFKLGRLHRLRCGWRFEGPVHEVLVREAGALGSVESCPFLVLYQDREKDFEKTRRRGRFEWDAEVLREETKKNPNHPRTWFYLGTTLNQLGRHGEALAAFEKRCEVGDGFLPESYSARLHCGDICHKLGRVEDALLWYLRATSFAEKKMKPRAEGLYAMGHIFESLGLPQLAFQFMRASCDAKRSHVEGSFNNKLYSRDRWSAMVRNAQVIGHPSLPKLKQWADHNLPNM